MQQKITKLSLKNNPDGYGMLNHLAASDLSTKLPEKVTVRDVRVSIVLY
jgi:hypothetical protein